MLIKQSEATAARRRVYFGLVDATDGFTPEVGITFSAGEILVSKNGGAFANATNTASVVNLGEGFYYVELSTAETDTLGPVVIVVKDAAARVTAREVQVVAFDPYGATNLGLTNLANPVLTADAAGDALLDRSAGVETGLTVRQALRIIAATVAGRRTGGGTTTEVYRNAVADAKARVTANNIDANGNPTSITYDLT